MELMDLFKAILLVQLFFSFGITAISHSVPEDTLNYVTAFSDATDEISLESVSEEVQDSVQSQTNIPVIELGALVFYSGYILIDLLLNFAYAIPEMIGLLINGVMMLFNVDNYLFALVELFLGVIVSIMYLIGIMEVLISIRSGSRSVI